MRKLIAHFFLCAGALGLTVQSARAFSLAGPIGNADDAWQTITLGYGWADPVAPKDIKEGYRPAVPVVYYTCDESFLNYYGASGQTSVDRAFAILNGAMCGYTNTLVFLNSPTSGVTLAGNGVPAGLPVTIGPGNTLDSYSPGLSEFALNTKQYNLTAGTLGLQDMESQILHFSALELGLADPYRYVWTLHDRFFTPGLQSPKCPQDEEYLVVQRNFDVSPGVNYPYSSYINGDLFTYIIAENCGNGGVPWSAMTQPTAVGLTGGQSAVTANGLAAGSLPSGFYYTALTRDDVMGLRYLLTTNNVNWENTSAASQLFTITTNFASQPFPPTQTGTNSIGSTNTVGFYFFDGNTNGGFGYGELGSFWAFTKTNNSATVQAAYPGVVIASCVTNWVWSSNQTYSFSFEAPLGSPYGTTPILTITTNYIGFYRPFYAYQFANIFTNHIYTNIAEKITSQFGPPLRMPYGTPPTNTLATNKISYVTGDFFVMPPFYTNVCPIDVVKANISSVVAITNLLSVTDTNLAVFTNSPATNNVNRSVYLVTTFTNYSYLINPVTCSTSGAGGTNSASLRRGLGRVMFIRQDFDSLLGQFFQPVTNYYAVQVITNSQPRTEYYARVVTQPDFLLQAADLPLPQNNDIPPGSTATTPQFDTAAIKTALAGPGTIDDPGMTLVFNKTLNDLYLSPSRNELSVDTNVFLNPLSETNFVKTAAWGSYDGSTNFPVVYPSGTSTASLMGQILIQATPSSLADGTVGADYNDGFPVEFTGSGGVAPYTWAAPNFSALVPGMTFSSSPPAIYGTPTTPGVFPFTILVTDSANRVVSLNYTITIH